LLGLSAATASRAGLLGAMVVLLFCVLTRRGPSPVGRISLVVVTTLLLLLGVLGLQPVVAPLSGVSPSAPNATVLRQENSRQEVWTDAVTAWTQRPLLGQGFGASEIETGNSLLKILVDLGVVGLACAMPFLLLIIRIVLTSRDVAVVSVTAGAVVNALFEAWLLTAGSAFFLIFCLLLLDRGDENRKPDRILLSAGVKEAG